jgi:hypothetical protein
VSSSDTSSDTSTNLSEKVCTPWMFQSVSNLQEYEAQRNGVLIRREYLTQSSSVLFGEDDCA